MSRQCLQFDVAELVEGIPSDQLLEVVDQVNLRLRNGTMNFIVANDLIARARMTEILAKYIGMPLENKSPQTLDVETRRARFFCR